MGVKNVWQKYMNDPEKSHRKIKNVHLGAQFSNLLFLVSF